MQVTPPSIDGTAGLAAVPAAPTAPMAQGTTPTAGDGNAGAIPFGPTPADRVDIQPLDVRGALQIMIAEVRSQLGLPPDSAFLQSASQGALQTSQTVIRLFLAALPEPAVDAATWMAAAQTAESTLDTALGRAVQTVSAWRDVPAAAVEAAQQTHAWISGQLNENLNNPLWLRPEWLGLAPSVERYWRRRRRARHWLSDPDSRGARDPLAWDRSNDGTLTPDGGVDGDRGGGKTECGA